VSRVETAQTASSGIPRYRMRPVVVSTETSATHTTAASGLLTPDRGGYPNLANPQASPPLHGNLLISRPIGQAEVDRVPKPVPAS
jgi:hypothetical protein